MRIATPALVLGIALGWVGATASANAALPTCSRQAGTTVRSNAQARVYETEPEASEAGTLTRLWACRIGSRTHVSLVDAFEDPFGNEGSYSSVQLAGLRVAYLVTSISPDTGTTREVDRNDLGGGRRLHAPVGSPVKLVMSGAGGVAWIESGAVRALTTSGVRVLDAGPVQARSLKRSGRVGVAWVRDGTRHTARVS